jgi:hypothetical protein
VPIDGHPPDRSLGLTIGVIRCVPCTIARHDECRGAVWNRRRRRADVCECAFGVCYDRLLEETR